MKRMKPKRMKSTQRMGIKQTMALDLHEIEVMATAKQHCTFCHDEHGVNTCGQLKVMSTHAKSYYLSNKDEKQMIDLKERLRVTMPVVQEVADGLVFNIVEGGLKKSNFIIHEEV